MEFILDDIEMQIEHGDNIAIPQGSTHKVTNIGDNSLIIVETQFGQECREDDIVRLEKIDERTSKEIEETEQAEDSGTPFKIKDI